MECIYRNSRYSSSKCKSVDTKKINKCGWLNYAIANYLIDDINKITGNCLEIYISPYPIMLQDCETNEYVKVPNELKWTVNLSSNRID